MASDSDLEAYFNQLSRKSHSLQKQNVKSDSPSLSKSTLTPTFDDDDDEDLQSRKVSSKQNFQKKKVETVPGSLLDIKSLSDKYSKRKPEISKKYKNDSPVAEESISSNDKERLYNGNVNKVKLNIQEYNKHNAVSKKPRSKFIDDDSSMDDELAKYLNETSIHEEEISKSSQYTSVKRNSSSNSSSSGSPLLNLNNLHSVGDILGTRTDDKFESENIHYKQIKSNQKEDSISTKNKSVSKRRSVQIDTQEKSESVVDREEKGSLLRNSNSTSFFHSKGTNDNSSNNNLQLNPPKKNDQNLFQNEETSSTEIESISVINENESIVEEKESIIEEDESFVEESENIFEESILGSDNSKEEDTKSESYSKSNNSQTSNANESISESSETENNSQRESAFENEDTSSRNKSILEKSERSEGRNYKTKKTSVQGKSKNKLNKVSETSVSSVEDNSGVKCVEKHTASSSKKKSTRKESKTGKHKESESEQKSSNRHNRHSRSKKKKIYTRSSRSSSSDSSSSDSSSLSDSELLNISKKLYQKLKHKKHSSYYEKDARKYKKWSYPVYTPSAYGMFIPPSFSSAGDSHSGILSHTAIMRQQVELTRMFMDSQRAMYSAYTSVLHSSQHFTTIRDTEKYIKKKRNPTLSFEEALKLVKEEMKSSQ